MIGKNTLLLNVVKFIRFFRREASDFYHSKCATIHVKLFNIVFANVKLRILVTCIYELARIMQVISGKVL